MASALSMSGVVRSPWPRVTVARADLRCAHDDAQGVGVQDIMIRIETDDFEAWKEQHYLHAQNRLSYGITDGPAYQDMDNPNAALFHIKTEDMDRAMEWFKSETFKEASRLAKVTGRAFYLAQPQAR
jgi:hypothetical protein